MQQIASSAQLAGGDAVALVAGAGDAGSPSGPLARFLAGGSWRSPRNSSNAEADSAPVQGEAPALSEGTLALTDQLPAPAADAAEGLIEKISARPVLSAGIAAGAILAAGRIFRGRWI